MRIKKIATSVVLAACLSGAMAVSANATNVHFGLDTGYAVGNVASTTVNGPVIEVSFIKNTKKNWRFQTNLGLTFLNGTSSNSTLSSIGSSLYLGEANFQFGYQVYPKLYTYGLFGIAGINSGFSGSNGALEGVEWGAGASYDLYKYMSVYAQYTGQSLMSVGVNTTGAFFTAGLQFHTALF